MEKKTIRRRLFDKIPILRKFGKHRNKGPSPFKNIPSHLWADVLLHLESKTLLILTTHCSLFRDIIAQPRFWYRKCLKDGIAPPLQWRQHVNEHGGSDRRIDYMTIGFKKSYCHNLAFELTPGVTLEGLRDKHAMELKNGGDGFKLESPPVGTVAHPNVPVCFATSFGLCERYFEIDLVKKGIQEWVLDDICPSIKVSEMYSFRWDCGAEYEIYVQLLNADERFDVNAVGQRFKSFNARCRQWEGGKAWENIDFTFDAYPRGIRRVGILSRGCDTHWWVGHYGSKFGNTRVEVEFPKDVRFKNANEFVEVE